MTYTKNVMLFTASLILLFAVLTANTALAASAGGSTLPGAESPEKHFDPKGKPPSEHTLRVIRKAREPFPFDDARDCDGSI